MRYIPKIILPVLIPVSLMSQTNVVLDQPLTENTKVTAISSITLNGGFNSNGYSFEGVVDKNYGILYSSTIPQPVHNTTPTNSKNYIQTIAPRTEMTSIPSQSTFEALETVQYFDGLGRLEQTVSVGGNPIGNDIIAPVLYDDFGRENYKFLPYSKASNGGQHQTNAAADPETSDYLSSEQYLYYQGSDFDNFGTDKEYPFAETIFENSPLNRVSEQGAAGEDWQVIKVDGVSTKDGHTQKIDYQTNTAETVRMFSVGTDLTDISLAGYYEADQLYIKQIEDENGNVMREYIDKMGRVVLKESDYNTLPLQTYYIYDDFGLLRCVVPPAASAYSTEEEILSEDYCYFYYYDEHHRMVEKKLPGADEVYMVYDIRDRLVVTQDGNLRDPNGDEITTDMKWLITKYDEFNRPVMTAEYSNYTERSALQDIVNNFDTGAELYESYVGTTGSDIHGYSNTSFPLLTDENQALTVSYYDNYDAIGGSNSQAIDNSGLDVENYSFSPEVTDNVKSLLTVSKIKVLGTASNYLTSVTYYDEKARPVQVVTENYLGDIDIISTNLNLVGDVLTTITEHNNGVNKLIVGERFVYDHGGRVLESYQQIAGNEEVLVNANKYNELGEIVEKYNHVTKNETTQLAKQKTDYKYNIRGWLTAINNPEDDLNTGVENDCFAMELCYNNPDDMETELSTEPQYNGNISAISWKDIQSGIHKAYGFSYDDINRLTGANFGTNTSGWSVENNYSVPQITYDPNGNIKTLQRYNSDGTNLLDNLTFEYINTNKSNQLAYVTDAGDVSKGFQDGNVTGNDYRYDNNGNLKKDLNKNITNIDYNYLNLPKAIEKDGNISTYTYTAGGAKLEHYDALNGKRTKYIGNFVYEDDGSGDELKYILTSEGRIVVNSGTYSYEYNLKDHLGNTRVTMDENGQVLQVADYYPFGMRHEPVIELGTDNKYLYNGKELQDDTEWYDYGARFYDAALGRFHVQDAYAEKYLSLTPYQYGANNPINVIDINGDSTYLVMYGAGYLNYQNQGGSHDVGDGFKKNAEAYAESIKNRQGYDANRDAVVLVEAKSTEQFTDATNATYGTGKIAEMTVFSHGYSGGVSLGGQDPNDPGVTQTSADAQLNDYDKREINDNTMSQIDKGNFEDNARTTFFGCNIGGSSYTPPSSSFGQSFADYMGGNRTVKAFTGSAEFTTTGGNGRSVTYSGRMIRSTDRASQQTRLTTFQKNQNPQRP